MTRAQNFKPIERLAEEAYAAAAQEILAKQIIMVAQRGERTQEALVITSPLAAELEPKAAA
jgi:hypothetical protein